MLGLQKWDVWAPVLRVIDPIRRRQLRRTLALLAQSHPISSATTVLDVGCGTGTLLRELLPYGAIISAVEPTASMARHVERKHPHVRVFQEPAHAMRSIPDNSQDLTIMSATLHGFGPEYRELVYAEVKRVTRGAVAIIDYHRNWNPIIALAELIEGGDYFRFVKKVDAELASAFPHVTKTRCNGYESLYLCEIDYGQWSSDGRPHPT